VAISSLHGASDRIRFFQVSLLAYLAAKFHDPRGAKQRFAREKHAMALAEKTRPATIEAILSIMPSPPIATSRGKPWGGVTIELYGARSPEWT
jgi:hypothetical protein